MRLCYISRNYYGLSGAGNKAKTDIEHTLQQMGAVNLGLRTTFYDNKVVAFVLNLLGILKMTCCIRKGDTLLLQYPVKKYFSFVCHVAHWRKARVIVVIHDLMSLHRKRITHDTEMSRLGLADVIIASNEKMQQWLAQQGLQCPMTALGLFDYLDQTPPQETLPHVTLPQETLPRPLPLGRGVDSLSPEKPFQKIADENTDDKSIYSPPSTGGAGGGSVGGGSLVDGSPVGGSFSLVYAGALVMRKNSYLLELAHKAQHFTLHIYGNSDGLPGIDKAPHAVCYPFTPADEFIRSADGDFGLVWDGDSLETCQGDFGEYLRYNSPHKVSFYLRAGLPVIIWREAAVAPIIEHEGIGFTIGSIAELEQRLQGLTPAELEQMRKNVARVSARLASGQFFREALQRVL